MEEEEEERSVFVVVVGDSQGVKYPKHQPSKLRRQMLPQHRLLRSFISNELSRIDHF